MIAMIRFIISTTTMNWKKTNIIRLAGWSRMVTSKSPSIPRHIVKRAARQVAEIARSDGHNVGKIMMIYMVTRGRQLTPRKSDDLLIERECLLCVGYDHEEAGRCHQKNQRNGAKIPEVASDHIDHSHERTRVTEGSHEIQN